MPASYAEYQCDLPRPVFPCKASIFFEASALVSEGSNSSPASSDKVFR